MEVVIKIDEGLYEAYKGRPPMLGDAGMDMIAQAIANGTPYNPKRDAISRSALKEDFDVAFFDDEDDYKKALRIIDNAPSVPLPDFKEGYKQAIIDGKTNFSRPQGEWVTDRTFNGFWNVVIIRCSMCNKTAKEETDFCPNCGADMRKGDTE